MENFSFQQNLLYFWSPFHYYFILSEKVLKKSLLIQFALLFKVYPDTGYKKGRISGATL